MRKKKARIYMRIIGGSAPPTNQVTLLYMPILGQSQAGGYNASPALTTVADGVCKTLTAGPIKPNTSTGVFINIVEGDTFSDTGGPAATPNVETMATGAAQQLKQYLISDNSIPNSGNFRTAATVHAFGNRAIQDLMKGGNTGCYEELVAAVVQVKALCDTNGWQLIVYPFLFHGGNGDNVTTTYQAKVEKLYQDLVTDLMPSLSQNELTLYCIQQRLVGTPDFGTQIYAATVANPNIKIASAQYPVKEQGDAIHLTNYAERHLGMFAARAIYREIKEGYRHLDLDVNNASFNRTTMELRIPVLNGKYGAAGLQIVATGDIQVISNTTSQTISVSVAPEVIDETHANLVLTFPSTIVGQHNLTLKTAITSTMNGSLASPHIRDSSNDFDPVAFVDENAAPYVMDKFLVRGTWDFNVRFPVNALIRFGGAGTDPGVPNTFVVWDNIRSFVDVETVLQGNFKITAVNTATNYWGFTGTAVKGGSQSITGTNYYPNAVMANYNFLEGKNGGQKLGGLDPNRLYDVRTAGCRTNTPGDRKTSSTIGGITITKQSNRPGPGVDSVYTTDAENAVFQNVAPNAQGEITITFAPAGTDGTNFGYLNAIQVTEK
jgi:hypothetical protein